MKVTQTAANVIDDNNTSQPIAASESRLTTQSANWSWAKVNFCWWNASLISGVGETRPKSLMNYYCSRDTADSREFWSQCQQCAAAEPCWSSEGSCHQTPVNQPACTRHESILHTIFSCLSASVSHHSSCNICIALWAGCTQCYLANSHLLLIKSKMLT